MSEWYHKIPVVYALVVAGAGLKMLAEKQMESVSKMRQTISLLELVNVPPEPRIVVPEAQPPKEDKAPVAVRTLVMHTMSPCVWCRKDKAEIIPAWISLGYNVTYVDEGKGIPGNRYPWYEINDQNGKRVHIGTLRVITK